MQDALDKYWTMSRMAKSLGISIQRLGRLLKKLEIEPKTLGAAKLIRANQKERLKKAMTKKRATKV